ncbi:uncharacterized protein LOC131574731 isoform X3 [Poecile atricapillus]|uniref:uncharacterized protein LOC131574731 isoform X3 n=1 Tax=Poecile atricapillus TaxID=48891 RepID=UPI0027390A29|nr:uncharacterized protein LOC131574731 isoform X3 [Poecile atricapillus]
MGTNIRLSWMFANILRKPILDVMGIKKKKKRWKIQVILSGSYSKENNTRPDMGRNSQEGQKPYETILPQEVNWARAHNNISVSQNPGSWNYTGVPLCWQIGQAPPWLLLTAPGHSNSPSQGSDCARLSQQVMEDGSTTQRWTPTLHRIAASSLTPFQEEMNFYDRKGQVNATVFSLRHFSCKAYRVLCSHIWMAA